MGAALSQCAGSSDGAVTSNQTTNPPAIPPLEWARSFLVDLMFCSELSSTVVPMMEPGGSGF